MDKPTLRLMIQDKVADGRLPHNYIPRVGGRLGNGETCDGCGETVTKTQVVMEGLSGRAGRGVKFHVACFYVWDATRRVLGFKPSGPAD
jgi:hypothetical protein